MYSTDSWIVSTGYIPTVLAYSIQPSPLAYKK
nr:MAG TPA: hypothetical protein [Caudoviricetes sp.]DAT91409.1 MAG TPA: hypothetical protein [Caudoviricetes sp.]